MLKPYFGNPFKAPGKIGCQSSKSASSRAPVVTDERVLEDESYLADELSIIGEAKDL